MDRALFRLGDIKLAISRVRILLAGKSLQDVQDDFVVSSAFERQLEIVSEASRHVPEEWKRGQGDAIDWRNIANLGNRLRHIYDKTDLSILWTIYTDDLDPLEATIDAMIAAHGPIPQPPPQSP